MKHTHTQSGKHISVNILLHNFQVYPMTSKMIHKQFNIIKKNTHIILQNEYPGGSVDELMYMLYNFTKTIKKSYSVDYLY